ncbi:MAG: hypothetical protein IT428_26075 [Planctomycetaceae bacterium]|nr:hypothetical protein [Planctomycetaceae bacterium]
MKATLLRQNRAGRCALAMALTLMSSSLLLAQGRETPRAQVRGVVKSFEAGNITLAAGIGREAATDRTFAVSPNVEIVVGNPFVGRSGLFQEAKAADVTPGATVVLSLSADEKTAEAIIAEEPQVRGVLKQVDVTARTLTIETQASRRDEPAEAMTFTISDDAELAIDDGRSKRFSIKEAKLTDFAPGAMVSATVSLDRKTLRSLLAEGPLVSGAVKAYDPTSRTLTLTGRTREGMEQDRVLVVAEEATLLVDDGKGKRLSVKAGKPTDVAVGSNATARLSVDQSRVMQLRIEGPTVFGQLKSADEANQTITITLFRNRTEPPEERTIKVAKDARITSDGTEAKLGQLKAAENGPFVQIRLSLDQSTAQSIVSRSPDRR